MRAADRFASYDELIAAIELVSTLHTRPAGHLVRPFAIAGLTRPSRSVGLGLATAMIRSAVGDADGNALSRSCSPICTLCLALGWRGTTPGKALLALEVVDDRHEPRARRWLRAIAREVGPFDRRLVCSVLTDGLRRSRPRRGLLDRRRACAAASARPARVAAWRRPGTRTPWDRGSGTQVRYRATRRDTGALLP